MTPLTGVCTSWSHFEQASQLYPMRTSTEGDSAYRYKPGSGSLGSTGRPSSPGQPVTIPVLHLGQSRSPSASSTPTYERTQSGSDSHPSTPLPEAADSAFRTSSYRTSSLLTPTGRSVNKTPTTNDQEAEVDALTNLLMQSMETRSSSSSGLGISSGIPTITEGPTVSPAGSLRRSSGSSPSLGLNSQIGRLQQHLGMNSNQVGVSGINGGRSSPLTTANPGNAPSLTCSSSTDSPTGSTTSVYNSAELCGAPGIALMSSNVGYNTCFRCRRALIPPEGTTLNSSLTTVNGSPNVVTLTGALAVRLHVACFTCYRCAAPLRPDAYYHSLRRLLCPTCVRDGAVETCSNCRRPIGDRVVHALGLPYHPNCFTCVICAGRLDSKPFTIDVHGRLHCLDDFHRRYAPKCTHCGRPIAPEPGSQEARRVVSGDSNYHLECFGVQTNSHPSSQTSKMSLSVIS
ncbi:unnamed protein product [Dicrocoelium dendriticum]|nr:unnamed protein product [Dicrocoelium dendriticum]